MQNDNSQTRNRETRSTPEDYARIVGALGRVRRRLFLDRLVRAVFLDLLIFLSLLVLVVFLERVFVVGLEATLVLAAVVGFSLLFSLVRTMVWGRVSVRDAAAATDGRLRLKERVATAVYLQETYAGGGDAIDRDGWLDLICRDGAERLDGRKLGSKFPVRVPRMAWFLLVPIAAGSLLLFFMPVLDILGFEKKRQAVAEVKKEVDSKKKDLDKKIEELEADAKRKRLDDLADFLKKLREKQAEAKPSDKIDKKSPADANQPKKEALVKLTKQEDAIKKALADKKFDAMKKALDKFQKASLKDFKLTRKLREALKEGDLKKSLKELSSLKRDLDSLLKKKPSELTPEERERLKKFSQEFERLAKDSAALQSLSKALSQLSRGLSGQNFPMAMQSMNLSLSQLQSLARQMQQMRMLRQALQLVRASKNDLRNLNSLAKLNPHRCPNCGKLKKALKPGQKPGGT